MNSQELRSLQEAYIGVYDESYKELPVDKMRGKVINHAASGVKKAITPHFKGTKGNTEGNVDDAKAKKSLNKAQKIQGEIKNREALGKDFYAGSKIGRSKFKGKNVNNEAVDLYDIILSHLLDEGYADTEQAATAIMVNMSEVWRDSVVEAYKELPVGKMIRKVGTKQFKHGMSVGSGASSNPKVPAQVGKMSAIASLHDPERAQSKSKMKKD